MGYSGPREIEWVRVPSIRDGEPVIELMRKDRYAELLVCTAMGWHLLPQGYAQYDAVGKGSELPQIKLRNMVGHDGRPSKSVKPWLSSDYATWRFTELVGVTTRCWGSIDIDVAMRVPVDTLRSVYQLGHTLRMTRDGGLTLKGVEDITDKVQAAHEFWRGQVVAL